MIKPKARIWTHAADEIIYALWGKEGDREIARQVCRVLPGKSPRAIAHRGKWLGLPARETPVPKWPVDEDNYLRQWIGKKPLRQVAREINRTPSAVYRRAKTIGLKAKRAEKPKAMAISEDERQARRIAKSDKQFLALLVAAHGPTAPGEMTPGRVTARGPWA